MHLIFITKYRKKIFISQELNTNLKNIIYDIAKKYNYKIIQMETDRDHIHILLEYNRPYIHTLKSVWFYSQIYKT